MAALVRSLQGNTPQFGKNCFLAENATIIGDVIMGDHCSVWYQAVIRGDVHQIRTGDYVNVQDGAVLHCTYQKAALHIGNRVSIGHRAIVHGCTVHDRVLIGMGAIVMDHAVIESGVIIAAGAVVLEKTIVEAGSVYAGIPARKVKDVDPALLEGQIDRIANNYVKYAGWYGEELRTCLPSRSRQG